MSPLILIAFGFIALILGGEILVRGAVRLAVIAGLSPMVIGVTLVGFGTSTPELFTSLQAAFAGSPGIAVGNVIGSNIANILLILGVAALVRPFPLSASAFGRDGFALTAATLLCGIIVLYGSMGRTSGGLLVLGLLGYMLYTLRTGQSDPDETSDTSTKGGVPAALALFAVGLVLTIVGARYLVLGAIDLAAAAGISDTVIGLTVVAIGTSLPELVTSVIAALRGRFDIALGNIIGSNIFNILGILGITALVHPLTVPTQIAQFDVWVMAAATLMLLGVMAAAGRLPRLGGAILVAGYGTYLVLLL